MLNEEKQNIVSLGTILLVTIPYLLYIFAKFQNESFTTIEELKFWATAILLLIPLRIVVEILMNIAFSIINSILTKETHSVPADERDKLIELKSTRTGLYVFCIGFIISLISIVLGYSISTMFTILMLAGIASELCDTLTKILYYRKGV